MPDDSGTNRTPNANKPATDRRCYGTWCGSDDVVGNLSAKPKKRGKVSALTSTGDKDMAAKPDANTRFINTTANIPDRQEV